jgi:hypothetical protein
MVLQEDEEAEEESHGRKFIGATSKIGTKTKVFEDAVALQQCVPNVSPADVATVATNVVINGS